MTLKYILWNQIFHLEVTFFQNWYIVSARCLIIRPDAYVRNNLPFSIIEHLTTFLIKYLFGHCLYRLDLLDILLQRGFEVGVGIGQHPTGFGHLRERPQLHQLTTSCICSNKKFCTIFFCLLFSTVKIILMFYHGNLPFVTC